LQTTTIHIAVFAVLMESPTYMECWSWRWNSYLLSI